MPSDYAALQRPCAARHGPAPALRAHGCRTAAEMTTSLAQAYQDGWNDALRTMARLAQNDANDLMRNPPHNPYAGQPKPKAAKVSAPE